MGSQANFAVSIRSGQMGESRLGQHTSFQPFSGHRRMTHNDARIFGIARQLLAFPDVSTAIYAAGGDLACVYYFSREFCSNRPVGPWAAGLDQDVVAAALKQAAAKIRDCLAQEEGRA